MSDSNRVSLRYSKETTWGETPSTPTMQNLRYTSESLTQGDSTTESQEVRSDLLVSDYCLVGREAGGSVEGELSHGTWDLFMEAIMCNNTGFAAENTVSGTLNGNATGNKFEGGVYTGISEGDWVKTTGFTDANNNGFFQAASAGTGTELAVTGAAITTDTGSGDESVRGSTITTGTDLVSFLFEREWEDVAEFASFRGMTPNTLTINAALNEKVTISVGFIGDKRYPAAATVGDGSPTAVNSEGLLTTPSDWQAYIFDDVSSTLQITSFSLKISNAKRLRNAHGTLGGVGVGLGSITVEAQIECYFASRTEMEQMDAFSSHKLAVPIVGSDGKGYLFAINKGYFTEVSAPVGGRDQDLIQRMTFMGVKDVNNRQLQIAKFDGI